MTTPPSALPETDVETLAQRMAASPDGGLQLIDVREPHEVELASVPNFVNLPLSQFPAWSGNIHTQFDH
ncbi:MAG: rhodanese, partial [Cyanobacteria bacterium J06650_10]